MELIKLNIGGQLFTTAKSTLVQRSDYFYVLLNGNWQQQRDETGAIFIDRDGETFGMVLKFLRNESVSLPEDPVALAELKNAADFYRIQSLTDLIKQDETVRQKAIDDDEEAVRVNALQQEKEERVNDTRKFDLYFHVWKLGGDGRCKKPEIRTVFGKTIRELKAVGFDPMFNLMRHCDFDNGVRMDKKADLKRLDQRLASMWLLLLDTFLYGESEREDKNNKDEVKISKWARQMANALGMDCAVIDKLNAYNCKLQVRQKAMNDEGTGRQKLVKLSVGGQHFTITKSILMQQSNYFNALLSGNGSQLQIDNDAIFIDGDSETFRVLLKFVRGEPAGVPENPLALAELKKAANVYGVQSLIDLIKRDEVEQKKVFNLLFYVWELNGHSRFEQPEYRLVSGKTIRELKTIGFQPMFNVMYFCDNENSYRMRQEADMKCLDERPASMWLILLDTFLYGKSDREDKNGKDEIDDDDEEIAVGARARCMADKLGMDRAVIEKIFAYNCKLQAKLKKK